jgi:isoquinoline 1-oxidoreductase beta subunit
LGGAARQAETEADWNLGEHAAYDSAAYKNALLNTVMKPGRVARETGNVDAEFAKGGKIIEASYYTPMLAHAPMEPPAAVAEFRNGKVEIWAATQNPQAVQDTVARALDVKKEDVLCHVTLLGGGFGRKSKPDYVAEAALLSKQVGKPVKIVWSREDDIHFDYFHSPAGMYIKAAVGEKGLPTAWLQRSAFPPIASQNDMAEQYGGFQLGMGWTDIPYPIANLRVENGPAQAHFRIGGLRSVSNIYHAFAVQSFTDELAATAGRDRVPARHHRPAESDRFRERGPEAGRSAKSQVSFRYAAASERDKSGGGEVRLGEEEGGCGTGAWNRSAPELSHLRCRRRRCRSGSGRCSADSTN